MISTHHSTQHVIVNAVPADQITRRDWLQFHNKMNETQVHLLLNHKQIGHKNNPKTNNNNNEIQIKKKIKSNQIP